MVMLFIESKTHNYTGELNFSLPTFMVRFGWVSQSWLTAFAHLAAASSGTPSLTAFLIEEDWPRLRMS
jgi:hypothetical protein